MSDAGLLLGLVMTGIWASGCRDSGTGPGGGNGGGGGYQPTVAVVDSAFEPTELVVRNGAVYWLDASTEPLNRFDLVTHAYTSLFQVLPHPENAVSDGNFVYWVSGGELYRTTLDGTSTTLFDHGERNVVNGVTAGIVLDADNVYWANTIPGTGCSPDCNSIRRVPKAGGGATTITTTAQAIVALAIQNGVMYWEEIGVGPVSADGTVGSQVKKVSSAGGSVTVLVDGLLNGLITPPGPGYIPASWHPTGGLAADDSTVYFADADFFQSYRVMKTPAAGGDAAPNIMAADTTGDLSDYARSLVLDQDHIYWVDLNSLKVMAKGGGAFSDLASNLTSPLSLVRVGGDLYWVEALCCAHNDKGRIERLSTSGGTPVTVRADITSPTEVTADQAALYWVEGGPIGEIEGFGGISRIGFDGTGERTLVTSASGTGPFAVDDAYLYFVDGFTIKRVAASGGRVQKLVTAYFFVRSIATDGAYVYWDDDPISVVHRIPVTGGPVQDISGGTGGAGTIRVDGSYVYWLDHDDTILRALKTGGSPTTVAGPVSGLVTDFVVSGTGLYYSEWDGGRIMRTAVTGGSATPLASPRADQTRRLATDGVNVYWVDQSSVDRVPVGGGNAQYIAGNPGSDPFLVGGIALDDHSVYWAEPAGFVIMVATPK